MNIKNKIQENISLTPFTTFKIGGTADFFMEIKEKCDLIYAYEWMHKNKQKIFILGGGSNLLISDQGVRGLVIKINNSNIQMRSGRLECGAGTNLSQAVRLAANNALSGLEWAVGIPGTIGGGVRGNAGAYGSEMANIVENVEVFNIKKNKFQIFSNKDCRFKYRESFFKKNKNYLIWSVILKLKKGKKEEINNFVDKCASKRFKGQPRLPSAGCVFKNIFIADLEKTNSYLADKAKRKELVKGGKIGIGWLIDMAGLKGKAIGGAKISLEHANFIVNTGKATAEDVVMLISYVKQQIRDKFKVQLQEEVQYLGFD